MGMELRYFGRIGLFDIFAGRMLKYTDFVVVEQGDMIA